LLGSKPTLPAQPTEGLIALKGALYPQVTQVLAKELVAL
jgi:hypothetical protein